MIPDNEFDRQTLMERHAQTLSENVQIRDALDPPNASLNSSVRKIEDQLKALTARFENNFVVEKKFVSKLINN